MSVQQPTPAAGGVAPRAAGDVIAAIICWWPRWSSRAQRCWTSAVATAICCNCSRRAASMAAASSCRARASIVASAKGLAVVQGDADTDLINYPDDAFDYVILSQTLQATRQPKVVLENLLRIGRRAIVSFPNFGYWKMRLQLLIGGQMPRTENLPATWYDTPNIHFCTIKDFVAALRRDQRQDGACGRAQPLRPAAAVQRALVVLEYVRGAGRVSA